jgi:hypothetical protein
MNCVATMQQHTVVNQMTKRATRRACLASDGDLPGGDAVSEAEMSAGRATWGAAEPFGGFSVVAAILSLVVMEASERGDVD